MRLLLGQKPSLCLRPVFAVLSVEKEDIYTSQRYFCGRTNSPGYMGYVTQKLRLKKTMVVRRNVLDGMIGYYARYAC